MIKTQYDKVKDHIASQFKEFRKTLDVTRKEEKEARDAFSDHFFDKEYGEKITPQYIDYSKRPLQEIQPAKHRIIYFCMKFKICTAEELAVNLHANKKTIFRVFEKLNNK